MITDYLLMIYFSSSGFLQIAFVNSGLRGLYIFPSSRLSLLSGFLLIALGFYLFFSEGPNHIPDSQGGLDGNQQLILFLSTDKTKGSFIVSLKKFFHYIDLLIILLNDIISIHLHQNLLLKHFYYLKIEFIWSLLNHYLYHF